MGLRPTHIIILIAVIVLLFGASRLPNLARSLGRSMRIMKAETRGLIDEPEPDDLETKADARSERQPLSKDSKQQADEAKSGEVIDPAEQRVRDN